MSLEGEMDLEVCAQASNAEDGLELLEEVDPDLIIVDISLQGNNGLELIKNVKPYMPSESSGPVPVGMS